MWEKRTWSSKKYTLSLSLSFNKWLWRERGPDCVWNATCTRSWQPVLNSTSKPTKQDKEGIVKFCVHGSQSLDLGLQSQPFNEFIQKISTIKRKLENLMMTKFSNTKVFGDIRYFGFLSPSLFVCHHSHIRHTSISRVLNPLLVYRGKNVQRVRGKNCKVHYQPW